MGGDISHIGADLMADFLPNNDSKLRAWADNFSTKITAQPVSYGLVAAQATAFAAVMATFDAALSVATTPATRTRGAIAAKDAAKKTMMANARDLARIINAFPSITNQQRIDLGLTPRSDTISPVPVPVPQESPVLEVVSANGYNMRLKLRSVDSNRRGKPPGVDGATIFSFVGSAPPTDIAKWKYEGSTSITLFDMAFPPTVEGGSQVWLTAFWYNPRKQSGPACTPISAYIAGGVGVSMAA